MPTKYPNILQLPFCCVPATLQKVLYRHGLDILDQEIIGAELGLRLPEKGREFFSHPDIVYLAKAPKAGFGTQIEKSKYAINKFFQHHEIPLKISELYHFQSTKQLEIFIDKNLKLGNDIILRYNNAIFKRPEGKSYGHFSLITELKKGRVIVSDTELPFKKSATLKELILATSTQIDGIKRGFYIIEKV
jgi:hypothetical protein